MFICLCCGDMVLRIRKINIYGVCDCVVVVRWYMIVRIRSINWLMMWIGMLGCQGSLFFHLAR